MYMYMHCMFKKLPSCVMMVVCIHSHSLGWPQSIPPTDADLQAVVTENSAEVMKEKCPQELALVDEKDVSTHTKFACCDSI